ncbi:Uncharacterized protein C9orf85 [Camellia lanceoleosa]|uniref:Uncharacterized protein C9orf85 n=1 Tax=Camellia lanceoleosa TaxID=1840588 RepID=A0ACC0FAW8_9ERIC|nr:Uncharacterized protein C9orf85 [Camellia lanceoleosa]
MGAVNVVRNGLFVKLTTIFVQDGSEDELERPPKHQNKFAWKPNAGVKINETEVGGKFRPLSDVTGVCHRCKDQIEWKHKYGKYKPLTEPAKCQRCSKRAVRQAYHNLCTGRNFKYSWICVIFCSSQEASRFCLQRLAKKA